MAAGPTPSQIRAYRATLLKLYKNYLAKHVPVALHWSIAGSGQATVHQGRVVTPAGFSVLVVLKPKLIRASNGEVAMWMTAEVSKVVNGLSMTVYASDNPPWMPGGCTVGSVTGAVKSIFERS